MKKGLILLAMSLVLSGCSWVQPLPGADDVALMQIEDVAKCQKLGSTRAQTLNKVTMFERDQEAMRNELIALAKNEAVRMRGDTIVQLSELKDGTMEFGIYDCY